MNTKTKDIKKVIKHKQEYVFHKSIEEAKKQGYQPTHKPFLNSCGTWMQEMKKQLNGIMIIRVIKKLSGVKYNEKYNKYV